MMIYNLIIIVVIFFSYNINFTKAFNENIQLTSILVNMKSKQFRKYDKSLFIPIYGNFIAK